MELIRFSKSPSGSRLLGDMKTIISDETMGRTRHPPSEYQQGVK